MIEELQNPQLQKVKVDLIQKNQLVKLDVKLMFFLILGIIISFLLPNPIEANLLYDVTCSNNDILKYPNICNTQNSKWVRLGSTQELIPANRFMQLKAYMQVQNQNNVQLHFSMNYNIKTYVINKDSFIHHQISDKNHTIKVQCDDEQMIKDNYQQCSSTIFKTIDLEDLQYTFWITFYPDSFLEFKIKNINYYILFGNEGHTTYSVIIKYILVIISSISHYFFTKNLLQIQRCQVIIEQKFVFVLGILLIMMNDPFYYFLIYYPGIQSAFWSELFSITFVACLFLFWMVMFDRIIIENADKQSKQLTKCKIVLITVLWFISLWASVSTNIMYYNDPTMQIDQWDENKTYGLFNFAIIITIIYGIFILYKIIKTQAVIYQRLWRHQMYHQYTTVFQIIIIFYNVSSSHKTYQIQNGDYTLYLIIINIYISVLQYLYCPVEENDSPFSIASRINQYQQYEQLSEQENFEMVVSQTDLEQNQDQSQQHTNQNKFQLQFEEN